MRKNLFAADDDSGGPLLPTGGWAGLVGFTPGLAALGTADASPGPTIAFGALPVIPIGPELLANSLRALDQNQPSVAGLAGGGFVLTWRSRDGDDSFSGVRAQIFDAYGSKVGGEFLVNTHTLADQAQPAVTALATGGFVVTWADGSTESADVSLLAIKAQIFDAAGARVGSEFLVNTQTNGSQSQPAIAALASGGFVASWTDAGSGDVKAQVYDAAGGAIGGELLVNTQTSGTQSQPAITALSSGGFVVSWTDASALGGDASGSGVKAQMFDAAGAKAGGEFLVNSATLGDQNAPGLAALASGGFVAVWTDANGDASGSGIKAQMFDASGARVGSEFLVNLTTLNAQTDPVVTALASGGFMVSWRDASGQDGDAGGTGIRAQIFDASGARVGTEFLVNGATLNDQSDPTIAALATGGFVVGWTDASGQGGDADGTGIKAQLYAPIALEQVPYDLKGVIQVDDADAGGGVLTLTLSLDYGVLDVDAGTGAASVSGSGTALVTVEGTLAQIRSLLAGDAGSRVAYVADTDIPPDSARLDVRLDDGGNAGTDPQEAAASLTIRIAPINDAPTGADRTIALVEDGAHIFTAGEFGFHDAEGNGFVGLVVTTLPAHGSLLLNGVPVTAGATIAVADIEAGRFAYAPAADGNGTGYAGFSFQLTDDGGTDRGGIAVDPTPDRISFDVAPVNDPPTVATSLASWKVGPELLVNTNSSDSDLDSAITALGPDRFVVTWFRSSFLFHSRSIIAQIVDASGAKIGSEFTVAPGLNPSGPAVAALSATNFVVAWESDAGGSRGILARLYNASGPIGSAFAVETSATGEQAHPSIAALSSGGFVVTWTDRSGAGGDTSPAAIKAQLFDAAGAKVGGERLVNSTTAGSQEDATVTALASGGFVVTWKDQSGDGSGTAIKAQIFDGAGAKTGGEFLVNTVAAGDQREPDVAALPTGGFIITWSHWDPTGGDGDGASIKAQMFDAQGAKVGGEFVADTAAGGTQQNPVVAALPSGRFLIAWTDESGVGGDSSPFAVKAQLFEPDGTKAGDEVLLATTTLGSQYQPEIAVLPSGRIMVSWTDESGMPDVTAPEIKAQILAIPEAVEQVPYSLKGAIAVGDVDAGNGTISVTLSADYGHIDAAAGNTGASVSGSGTGNVTVAGTLAQVQAFLASASNSIFAFVADSDDPPASARISVTIDDHGNTGADPGFTGDDASEQASASFSVLIVPAADAPTAIDQARLINQDTTYIFTPADFGFSDPDGDGLSNVAIYDMASAGKLMIDMDGPGGNEPVTVQPPGSGGPALIPLAVIEAGGLFFFPEANQFGADYARFHFAVESDGDAPNLSAQHLFTFNVNAAPTVSITPRLAPVGPELLLNTTTAGNQIQPAIASLTSGGFVASWAVADGPARGVKLQMFDAAGARIGAETNIISDFFSQYDQPCVAALPGGGFVICWHGPVDSSGFSLGPDIYGQVFDAAGGRVGDMFVANTDIGQDQFQPSITPLASGGFVVAWTQGATGFLDVRAQVFDAAGAKVGSEFQIGTGSGDQNLSSVTALPSGGFVVAWRDVAGLSLPGGPPGTGGDGSGAAIRAQIFTAAGAAIGPEILVNTTTSGDQSLPSIATLASGGFVVTWQDASGQGGDASGGGVKGQVFSAAGIKLGGEFLVNSATLNAQSEPSVAALPTGGFIVSWTDASGQGGDASGTGIKAQLFDAAGAKVGGEVRIDSATLNGQSDSSLALLSPGRAIVSWTDQSGQGGDTSGSGIKAQLLEFGATEQVAYNLKSSILVADADAGTSTMTVRLSVDYGILTVTAGTSGASVAGSGTGSVTLTGTLAQIQALLGSNPGSVVTFTPDTDNPPPSALLTVTADDGHAIGTDSLAIAIAPVNDAPTLAGLVSSLSFAENLVNAEPQLIDADVVFSDPEDHLGGGILTVSGLLAEDRVGIRNEGAGAGEIGVSGTNVTYGGTIIGSVAGGTGGALTVTFNASATSAAVDALIQNLTYGDQSDTPGGSRTLTIAITDGAGAPLAGGAQQVVVAVTAQGEPPLAAGDSYAVDEDGRLDIDAASGVLANDNDADTAHGALTAILVAGPSHASSFALNPDGSFLYVPAADYDGPDSFAYKPNDGASDGDIVTVSLAVAPVNDAPTIAGFAPDFAVIENDAPQPIDGDVTFNDPDDNFDGGVLTVSGLLAEDRVAILDEGTGAGQIGVSGTDVTYGGGVIGAFAGGDGTTLTVTFNAAATSAAIDALIEHLTYEDVSDTPTADRILTLDVVDAAGAHLIAPHAFAELTGVDNPLAPGLPLLGTDPAVAFVDVDHDGVLDIVDGGQPGDLRYFHNSAGFYVEVSGAGNPFDGFDAGSYSSPTAIDIDGDGDMDLAVGGADGNLSAFRNNGDGSWTHLTSAGVNPFDGINVGTYSDPAGADIDGDGDMDLVVGNGAGFLAAFQHNADHSFTPLTGSANPFDGASVGQLASPDGGDIDRDGDVDLVVGNAAGTIETFVNDGAGGFTRLGTGFNPFDGVDVGNFSIPTLVDLDGDGNPDLAVTDDAGGDVRVFGNGSAPGAPAFAERTGDANPLATGLPVLGTDPAVDFVDVDHDGALDLVVGDQPGTLRYFRNEGGGYTEVSGGANPFDGFDAGLYSSPAAIDIDGDGDMDLVIGGGGGTLFAFRNNGDGSWTSLDGAGVNPFDGITVGTYTDPAGADIDGDGDMDLIVGDGAGLLEVFRQNADHSFTQLTGADNPFDGVNAGQLASPAAGDIDGDGDADLVVGNADGTIEVFRNDNGTFTHLTGADNPFDGLDVGDFSIPALVDIDGDGDADLAVTDDAGGDVRVFENRSGAVEVTVTSVNDAPTVTIQAPVSLPVGGEVQVNTTVAGEQAEPSAAGLNDGSYVIVWADLGRGHIYQQHYGPDGAPIGGEAQIPAAATDSQDRPAVIALADGGYVVAWVGDGAAGAGVYAQLFDSSGAPTGGEIAVAHLGNDISHPPAMTALPGGGFAITWQTDNFSSLPAASGEVEAQVFDASGVPVTAVFQVNTTSSGWQGDPSIALTTDGGFRIAFTSRSTISQDDVRSRDFDADGTPNGNDRVENNTLSGSQNEPAAALAGGTEVIVWRSAGTLVGIYQNLYHTASNGSSVQEGSVSAFDGSDIQVTGLTDGTYVLAWDRDGDGKDVVAARYDANGSPLEGVGLGTILTGDQLSPSVAALPDGFVAAWLSNGEIEAQRFAFGFNATEQNALDLKHTINIADPDAGTADVTATLSVDYGVLHVDAGTSGATIVSGNDSDAVTVSGTIDEINALLGSDGASVVTYTADTDAPPEKATLTVEVDDGGATGSGGALTGSDSVAIAIAAVNDAPFIDLDATDSPATDTSLTYGEGQAPVLIAPLAIASDPDQPADYGGYTVTVAFTANGTADDQLDILSTGFGPNDILVSGNHIFYGGPEVATFTGGDNGAPLVISFNGNACGCSLEAIIEAVAYSNVSDDPSTLDRSVTFTVDDGAASDATASAVATIHVVANDPPVLTDLAPSVTFAEHVVNAAPQLLDANVTLTDTEGNFDGGTLTVTGLLLEDEVGIRDVGTGSHQVSVSGSDVLYEGTIIGSVSGGHGDSLSVLFNADATAEGVDAVIENLTYADLSDSPTASRTLMVNVTDSFGADLGVSGALVGVPHFQELAGPANPFDGVAAYGLAAPAFVDLDGDGDMDLVVGDAYANLRVFSNDHGAFTPVDAAANPFFGLSLDNTAKPAFVDIDGDHDLDLVVGGATGGLQLFTNDAGVFTEATGAANPFDAIHVYYAASPAFADLDGDGDLDLVVGDYEGALHAFDNDHGVFTELTGSANPFGSILVDYSASPVFVDLDGDGDMDLVVGDAYGRLHAFTNDGGAFTPLTGADDPFNAILAAGYFAAPAFADLDGDGDFDLVIGNYYGAVQTFENTPPHGQQVVVNVTAENDAPLLDLDIRDFPQTGTSASFTEGDPPLTIAPFALFADPDQPADYGGYIVTVAFTQNGGTGDMLSIANLGPGANEIAVSGSNVLYEGVVVGSFTGGTNGDPLVVTFNNLACACSVELTLANILFSNASEDPSALTRTITFTLDDGAGGTATADATIAVTAVDDLPVAQPDAIATTDATVGTGNVFADNGSGVDSDVDGPALTVSAVNGVPADVGATVTLASGAKLTLLANGNYSYDPNGAFNSLVPLASGAVNTHAADSFNYTLANGNTVAVTVTVNGTEGPGDIYKGDGGDNTITSGTLSDTFDVSQGGTDHVHGNGGNDYFFFGNSFDTADTADGGAGTMDVVGLLGNYNMTLAATSFTGIERLTLFTGTLLGSPNHVTYTITTVDENVASGDTLTVLGNSLLSDETMVFNGSAETNGSFYLGGGAANDILVGGQKNDSLVGGAGDDQLYGLGGNDYIVGGIGADTLRGGFGLDRFVYNSAAESTATSMDYIRDFENGTDKIDLSAIDANGGLPGDQAFTFIGANAFDGTAGELRAFQSAGHWFIEADTNGDMSADLVIKVDTFHPIVGTDFIP